jgi:Amino acid transporters
MDQKQGFRRSLGMKELVSLGVGGTIGSGIFVVPGIAAAIMGSASLFAWVIVACSATCVLLSLSWIVPLFGREGSFYSIFHFMFGEKIATLLILLYVFGSLAGIATIAAGIGQYLSFFGVSYLLGIEIAIIILFCGMNIIGISISGMTENVLTILKIVPLVIISIVLIPFIDISNLVPFPPVAPIGLVSTILIVYWPFTGFEISAIPVNEVKDTGSVSKALLLVMVLVTAIYLALNISLIGSAGSSILAGSPAPIAAAVSLIYADSGGIIGIIGIIAMLSAINAYIIGSSRTLHSFGNRCSIPGICDLNTLGTPAVALVMICVISAALLLVSNQFAVLAVISVVATLLPYIAFCIMALVLLPGAPKKIIALSGALSTLSILTFFFLV